MRSWRRAANWVLPLGAALLAGCTLTREGTLEELPSAVSLPVTVALAADSAWVRALDPRTGEVLQGRLTLDPSGPHSRPTLHPEPALPSGSAGLGAAGAGVPLRGGTAMHLIGRLEGNQGTVLRCTAQVEQGLRLRGAGVCHELREGTTRSFRLRF
jgi:hypothetical protein